ncbi:MAG: sigma-70 family RNA polymerase sigma factor [Oscillospiraceae bacterium]
MLNASVTDELVESNIGLVHSCARRFTNKGIDYDDLFQAGCMGLVKACRGFEVERGFRFSTYAVPVILGEIKRLFRDGGSVKVSRRLKELSVKASRLSLDLLKETGEEPTTNEIASRLGCEEQLIIEAICASRPSVSLTVSEDEEESHESDIPVLDEEELISERLSLKDAIAKLGDDERVILAERYYKNRTQSQTAELLGTTQVQISRRERRIIAKLRELMAD